MSELKTQSGDALELRLAELRSTDRSGMSTHAMRLHLAERQELEGELRSRELHQRLFQPTETMPVRRV